MPPVGHVVRTLRPRWLGAPVDGAEHLAVAAFLIFLLVSIAGLGLARAGWFAPAPLMLAAVASALAVAGLALPMRVRSRGVVPALAVAAIAVVALEITLPPAQPLLGGGMAGATLTTGADLARHGRFEQTDPYLSGRVPEARAAVIAPAGDVEPVLLPGSFLPDNRDVIVPKYPLLLPVWTGVGVLIAGPLGGLAVAPLFGAASLALFFLMVRRASGGRVAALATLLLTFNGVQVWHSTLAFPDMVLQGMLSGGLLSGLLSLRDPRRLYAASSGLAVGLLPLVQNGAAVVAAVAAAALLLAFRSRRSPAQGTFLLALGAGGLASAAHYLSTARLSFTGQIAAGPEYLVVAGGVLLLGGLAFLRLRGKQQSPSELSPPSAVIWAVLPVALLVWLGLAAMERHPLAPLEILYGIWLGSYLSLWDTAVLAVGLAAVVSGGIPRVRRAEPAIVLGTLAVASALFLALYAEQVLEQDQTPLLMQATRRLLPTVIPLLAVLEAAALVRWLRALPGGRGPVLLAAAAALMLARLPDVAPLIAHRDDAGAVEQIASLATRVEPDAVLLFDADTTGTALAGPLRSLYERTSYIVWNPDATEELAALIGAVQRDGRPVYYVTSSAGMPVLARSLRRTEATVAQHIRAPELERTSARRPAAVTVASADVLVYRVLP